VIWFCSTDVVPKNIAVATNSIPEYNIMPVYGKKTNYRFGTLALKYSYELMI
jgi:hypothetical protein